MTPPPFPSASRWRKPTKKGNRKNNLCENDSLSQSSSFVAVSSWTTIYIYTSDAVRSLFFLLVFVNSFEFLIWTHCCFKKKAPEFLRKLQMRDFLRWCKGNIFSSFNWRLNCLCFFSFDSPSMQRFLKEGEVQGEHFERLSWSEAWSPLTPTATLTLTLTLKAGFPLPSWSGAAAGWPVPPLQPLIADLPCLDGSARFCLLSGSVPPSQTSLLATAVHIPTEQALEKKKHTHTETDTQVHTYTLFTLGTLSGAHNLFVSLSLPHVCPFQNSPTHWGSVWFHTQNTMHRANTTLFVPAMTENSNLFLLLMVS